MSVRIGKKMESSQDVRDLTVAERMRSSFDILTRAERQLADALLENYPVSGLASITGVAEASSVSTPTVVRMAKKLGFSGFPEMQAALRSELEARISSPIVKHDRWAESAPDTHILNRFADAAMDNLLQTLRRIDPQKFDQVTALLADDARTVHVVGGRITHSLSEHFFTHMQVIRSGVTQIASNSNTWPHYVLNMKKGDVLVAFDIRRYERDILRLTEIAKSRGVTVVLLTDQWGSPVEDHATHSLHCRIEVPSAWDSSVVLLFVVEALITAVQTATWGETRDRMNTLETLFDQMKLFRKFT